MAIIINEFNPEEIILHCQHTFGRDRDNLCCIKESDVSRKHAIIYYENKHWYLIDLSTNGTKVNNELVHHSTKILEKDDVIQFSSTKQGIWKIVNVAMPNSFFEAIHSNHKCIDLGKGVFHANEQNHKWSIFRNKDQKWMMDDGENEIIIKHGEVYTIDGTKYKFIENECLANTFRNFDIIKNACFHFFLSVDEENVSSKIEINDLVLDLGVRVYNQLLLQLAKIKQQDIDSGLKEQNCGWIYIEDLEKVLSKEMQMEVDMYYINVLIYRLRKSLIKLSPYGYLFAHIIERQKGKLRFGFANFQIEKERTFA